eukprot:11216489-Alexandrium_andersonii.AAC.1
MALRPCMARSLPLALAVPSCRAASPAPRPSANGALAAMPRRGNRHCERASSSRGSSWST